MARLFLKKINFTVSPLLLLFIIGWNLWFFVDFFAKTPNLILDYYITPMNILRYTASGILIMFIASMLSALKGAHRQIQFKYRVWVILYTIWLIFILMNSFYVENAPLSIIYGASGLLFPYFAYIGINRDNWKLLINVMLIHQVCAVLFAIIFLFKYRLVVRTTEYTMPAVVTFNYLYATPLLMLGWSKLKAFGRVLTVAGLIAMTGIAVSAQFRSILIMVMLTICFGLYNYFRLSSHRMSQKSLRFLLVFIIIFSLFSVLTSLNQTDSYFAQSAEKLYSRFQEGDFIITSKYTLLSESSRFREALLFLTDSMQDFDWLIGKGLGARWWAWGAERVIVHIGFVHFIFIGGIPLLLLFLYFPIKDIFLKFYKTKDIFLLSSKLIMTLWFIELFYYGIPDSSLKFVIIGLCMGLVIAKQNRVYNHI